MKKAGTKAAAATKKLINQATGGRFGVFSDKEYSPLPKSFKRGTKRY